VKVQSELKMTVLGSWSS